MHINTLRNAIANTGSGTKAIADTAGNTSADSIANADAGLYVHRPVYKDYSPNQQRSCWQRHGYHYRV